MDNSNDDDALGNDGTGSGRETTNPVRRYKGDMTTTRWTQITVPVAAMTKAGTETEGRCQKERHLRKIDGEEWDIERKRVGIQVQVKRERVRLQR